MKKLLSGALALAALSCAPLAHAACPTAPTYSTLTGKDAAAATQSLRTWQAAGINIPTPMIGGWNGTAFVQLSANADCAMIVDGSGYTQPAKLLDSGGGDATDTVNHAVRASATNIVFTGTTTALTTGSPVYTGATRDTGVAPGSPQAFAYFNGFFLMDQVGTAEIDGSNDNSTWYVETSGVLSANTGLTLTVPVMFRYQRSKLTLTAASNATVTVVNSSLTAN